MVGVHGRVKSEIAMNGAEDEYRVELDTYAGPLDLLLYLIKRSEVEISDIPIAEITEQYVRYTDLMGKLSIEIAGEFLVMAATLMEIKSRFLLPEPPEEEEEEWADPRLELVQQLLEYKKYKEAATELSERAEAQSQRFQRPGERPSDVEREAGGLQDMSLWRLLDVFNQIVAQTAGRVETVVIDDTPVEVSMAELEKRLRDSGPASLRCLLGEEGTVAKLLNLFVALLELIRLGRVRAQQERPFGEIQIGLVPDA